MKLSPIRLAFCAYAYNLNAVTGAIPMVRVLGEAVRLAAGIQEPIWTRSGKKSPRLTWSDRGS
ncbi:MAG: hypothetical protein U9R58_13335 [Chloroflexota bacterium]|nr:hypothetical protein [Chloroflexota bacterium]